MHRETDRALIGVVAEVAHFSKEEADRYDHWFTNEWTTRYGVRYALLG